VTEPLDFEGTDPKALEEAVFGPETPLGPGVSYDGRYRRQAADGSPERNPA